MMRSIVGCVLFCSLLLQPVQGKPETRKERVKALVYATEDEQRYQQQLARIESVRQAAEQLASEEQRSERREQVAAWRARSDEKDEKNAQLGRYAHVYAAPCSWLFTEQTVSSRHSLRTHYSHTIWSKAFDEHGERVDASASALGASPQVYQMLLASALVTTGAATVRSPNGKDFVQDIAGVPFSFTSHQSREEFKFSYTITAFEERLSMGILASFIDAHRELEWKANPSPVVRELIKKGETGPSSRNGKFVALYGYDINAFFTDMIEQKGMALRSRQRVTSPGDVVLFLNAAASARYCERVQCSAHITLPAAKRADLSVFHPLEVGNGGFVTGSLGLQLIGTKTIFGYPHLSVQIEAGLPRTVHVRVPKLVVTTVSEDPLPSDIVFGELAKPVDTVSAPECTIPAFSQSITALALQPGASASFRAGLVVLPILFRNMQIDLAYELSFKQAQTLHGKAPIESWYLASFSQQPHQIAHRLRFHLSQQPYARFHWQAGGYLTFLGRATNCDYGYSLGCSYLW